MPSSSRFGPSLCAVPLCVFVLQRWNKQPTKKSRFCVVCIVCFSYRDMFYFLQMQAEQDNFLHVHKYGLNWYIYKVCKKNQKKVKKNLQIKILFVPLYRKQERTTKQQKNMEHGNIDTCWEALEKAVNGLNDGRGTLSDIVEEFGLKEWRPGRYMEPRWGWPIEYDPEVGYYLCY